MIETPQTILTADQMTAVLHLTVLTPDLWERCLLGPEASPNPADWRTELNQPLLG